MKAKRVGEACGFEPVTIEVTFETQAELEQFWHRMNIAYSKLYRLPETEDYSSTTPTGQGIMTCTEGSLTPVWRVVDEILQDLA